jgi:hypothetical protein
MRSLYFAALCAGFTAASGQPGRGMPPGMGGMGGMGGMPPVRTSKALLSPNFTCLKLQSAGYTVA